MKRSRIVLPSSQREIRMLTHVNPIESTLFPWEKKRPAVKNPKSAGVREYPPRDRVPTFELQTWEPNDASSTNKRRQDSEFLNACSFCKKKFDENGDIFMYGYKGAFCSPKCRNDQILLDGFVKMEDSNESFLTKHVPRKGFDTRRIQMR